MAYQRKTYDEWQIHTDYGYGEGYELECIAEDAQDARRLLKEYRENAPQWPHRIVKRRIPISER